MTERAARHVNLRNKLVALPILRSHDFDRSEQRRDREEQACVGDEPAGTDPTSESKACGPWVPHRPIEIAVRREVTAGVESLRFRIVFRIV
jgi:hypothetical protein